MGGDVSGGRRWATKREILFEHKLFSPLYSVSLQYLLITKILLNERTLFLFLPLSSQRYAIKTLEFLDSISVATRRIGAISTNNDGTTSLSKSDSPKFPIICVLSSCLCGGSGPHPELVVSSLLKS